MPRGWGWPGYLWWVYWLRIGRWYGFFIGALRFPFYLRRLLRWHATGPMLQTFARRFVQRLWRLVARQG
jgi:hypothetical protein